MKKLFKALKEYLKYSDLLLFVLCIIAAAFGFAMIYSATRSYGSEATGQMTVQLFAIVLGIILYVIFSIIDIEIIADKWLLLLLFNFLIISSLFIWGVEGGGNKSWLRFFGVGVQPAEIVKVSFIILLSKQLKELRESKYGISSVSSIIVLLLHFGAIFVLILIASDDLGSALVFAAAFLVMLFAAGVKLRWFVLGGAVIAALSPLIWNNVLSQNQKDRIMAPYFPEIVDPTGLGITWHATQSKIALASGQLTGLGYLNGTQSQSSNLPAKHTDFIFAVVGEELGLLGCLILVAILSAIIVRCIYVGVKSKSYMNMLICAGFAGMFIFQTFENIGMCMGITPVIGITLPFISYGGSSMLMSFAAMGIVSGIRMRNKEVTGT